MKDFTDYNSILNFIRNNEAKINGINVSRHMCLKTNLENDEIFKDIKKYTDIPVRINSVLLGIDQEKELIPAFIAKYADMVNSISFRGDYTKIVDQNSLRGLDHPVLDILFELPGLSYLGSGGCLVCNNNDFILLNGVHVCLHRGYMQSLVRKGSNYIINDFIIKQDGTILIDWDGEKAELAEIIKQWTNTKLYLLN